MNAPFPAAGQPAVPAVKPGQGNYASADQVMSAGQGGEAPENPLVAGMRSVVQFISVLKQKGDPRAEQLTGLVQQMLEVMTSGAEGAAPQGPGMPPQPGQPGPAPMGPPPPPAPAPQPGPAPMAPPEMGPPEGAMPPPAPMAAAQGPKIRPMNAPPKGTRPMNQTSKPMPVIL